MTNLECWVYVWRLCPTHLWHQAILDRLIARFWERCLLVLWSSNAPFTLRNFFSYEEKRWFAKKLYPWLDIVWLPDYGTDEEWLLALDDLIRAWWKWWNDTVLSNVTFMWGCEEDVDFFFKAWRKVEILNRFDGSTPKVSATEVRDALIHWRNLSWLVDDRIANDVIDLFNTKWELFKRK